MSYFNAKMLQNRFLPAYDGRAYSAYLDLLATVDLRGPTYKGEGEKSDLADQQKILLPPLLLAVMHC